MAAEPNVLQEKMKGIIHEIERKNDFRSRLIMLIQDLKANEEEIIQLISENSELDRYDVEKQKIILTSTNGLFISFELDSYIRYINEYIEFKNFELERYSQIMKQLRN